MLEFKSRILQFKFNDTVCNVKYPTIKALSDFKNKTKGQEEDSVDNTIEFLASLGLQREVAEQLEVSNLQQIIETLTGDTSKKN